MATKKDLEEQIKVLKDEVRKLRKDAKEISDVSDDLNEVAYGISLEDNSFILTEIKHDGKNSVVGDSENLGINVRVAASKIQKKLTDKLVELNKGR